MASTANAVHLLNPLASAMQMQRTPSREDGISAELESDLRAYGGLLIQQAGIHLRAPQVVMTTAAVLFQRFWFVSSFRNYGLKDTAAAALFLSSKLEEHPIRVRDLINAFDYLLQRVAWETSQIAIEKARSIAASYQTGTSSDSRSAGDTPGSGAHFIYRPMDYFAKEFYDFKDDIVIGESQILKRLGFNTTVQNPYGSIVNYLQVMRLTEHPEVPQRAWSFANDVLLTPLLAIHPPHVISVSCIYLACAVSEPSVALPLDPAPWWELFDVESEEEIMQVCRPLLELYQRWTDDDSLTWLTSGQATKVRPARSWSRSVWRRAADLRLPVSKDEVRAILSRQ